MSRGSSRWALRRGTLSSRCGWIDLQRCCAIYCHGGVPVEREEGTGAADGGACSGGQARVITEAEVTYTYTPNTPSVPGPLPLVGAAAAWRWSRRLRGLRATIA